MMLTLRRIFLGLNGMAIDGKQVDIHIIPEKNKNGNVIATKWFLSGAQFDDESLCLKDFLAGIRIDEPENDVPIKFYDATSKYARFITDRTANTNMIKHGKKGTKSAFKMLLEIIQACINNIDDTVLDILLDENITRGKCKIIYPLLREIPADIQTPEELLNNFISLARPGENVVRYWRKILVLNNRRFWISNHIFKMNIQPFQELMSDLTGIELVNFNPLCANQVNDTNHELVYAEALKKESLILFNKFQQGQISLQEYLNSIHKLSDKYSMDDFNNSFVNKVALDDENNQNEDQEIVDDEDIDATENLTINVEDSIDNKSIASSQNNSINSNIDNIMKSTFGFF